MKQNVTILAKNPFTTRVKTRLGKDIGADAARGVYARLLYQTLINLVTSFQSKTRLTLSLISYQDQAFFATAFPELEITLQASGDLGDRMYHALAIAFQKGAQKAIVIGSDLPSMNWELLEQAFERLEEKTVVIGPSLDGGYYLIGMQAPGIDVFKDISWSSDRVLNQTLERIQEIGWQSSLLPEQEDIDLRSDLERWQASLINLKN